MTRMLDSRDDFRVVDQKGRIVLGSKYAGKRFAVREELDGSAVLIPVKVISAKEDLLTSDFLNEQFASMAALEDNWDGRGSLAPTSTQITAAREVFALLQAGVMANVLPWAAPHIGSNELGQVTLEWRTGKRSLTIFVRAENQVDFLKSWGSDIESEVEDGEIRRLSDFLVLSRWLSQEESESS